MKAILYLFVLLIALVAFAMVGQRARQRRAAIQNWTGTWVYSNDPASEIVTISAKDDSLSASFEYRQSAGRTGNGQWKNCKMRGNTVTCDWTAKHDDPEKTGTRTGSLKMTLSGDTISGSYLEDYASWNWKPGYGPHVFDGSMGKDVVHTRTYKRKPPGEKP